MLHQKRGISLNKNALNTLGTPSPPKLKPVTHQNNAAAAENPLKASLIDGPVANQNADMGNLKKAALCEMGKATVVATDENLIDLDFSKPTLTDKNTKPQQQPGKESQQLLKQIITLPMQLQQLPKQLDENQAEKQVAQRIRESRIPRLSLKLAPLQNRPVNMLPAVVEIKPSTDVADEESGQSEDADEDIEDIDKSTNRDATFLVTEIAKDIYDYMRTVEEQQAVSPDYLREQKILTPARRERMVKWCIYAHAELKLLPETTYMTIALFDRYFDRVPLTEQSQMQLVAVTSTLIASKYEEIYPPDISDLVYLSRNAYSKRDITRTEIEILDRLEYNLGRPVPLAFLRRFSKAAHCDLKMHSIAKFLMEISLPEYECSHWRPSLLAAAALYVTLHLVNHEGQNKSVGLGLTQARRLVRTQQQLPERWTKTLVHYSHYNRRQLQHPASVLCKVLKKVQKNAKDPNVDPQYVHIKKNYVNLMSRWPELKSPKVDELIRQADQRSRI